METLTFTMDALVDADKAWLRGLSRFGQAREWAPMARSCEVFDNGSRRRLELPSGDTVTERFVKADDERCTGTFAWEQTTLPVRELTMVVRIEQNGRKQCEIHWDIRFEPEVDDREGREAAREAVRAFMAPLFVHIQGLYGGSGLREVA